ATASVPTVFSFGKGGACETVLDGVAGLLFHEQSPEAICDAVVRFEKEARNFDPIRLRAHAENFSTAAFLRRFRDCVESKWAEQQRELAGRPSHEVVQAEVVA